MSIKEKALLVSLSISMWTNAVHDDKAGQDVARRNSADSDVVILKKTLIKQDAMAQVRSCRIALRSHWLSNTLPWGDGGIRVLPSDRYQVFVKKFRELKADYIASVEAFCKEYPKMKLEARRRLGKLYDDDDFPTIDSIRRRFDCEFNFVPIPDAGDFRVHLSEAEKKELGKDIERQVTSHAQGAMKALVLQLKETIEMLAARMKEDDPGLRKSLVENVNKMAAEMTAFNFEDDKQVEAFKKAAETLVKGVDIDVLKEDKKARKVLATKADEILEKMAAYTGGLGR